MMVLTVKEIRNHRLHQQYARGGRLMANVLNGLHTGYSINKSSQK